MPLKHQLVNRLPFAYNMYLRMREPFQAHIFSKIYRTNRWADPESVSGAGSSLQVTHVVREELPRILKRLGAASLLDAACGDHLWMSRVHLDNCKYMGCDIVPKLIEENRAKYGERGREFRVLDVTKDRLPRADVVLVRDCFVHLPHRLIWKALRNIGASGSKYLLTTTYPRQQNSDIFTGRWRPLNLQASPFLFPEPLLRLNEEIDEWGVRFPDRSLALWPVSAIPKGSETQRR